jgi:stage V sporulation protein SpoVS
MNPEDVAAAALAGLNNHGDAHPAVIEATGDAVNSRSTAIAVRCSSEANDTTELVVVSSANDSVEKKSKRGRKRKENQQFPVEPRVIQVVKKPRTYMNHSYRDFSLVPAEIDYEAPEKISDMTFAQKVHHILTQEEYKKLIGWLPHGRAFQILSPKRLEQAKILEKYFGHGRYSSFLRQLSNHGFKHISRGPDRNSYYYEVRKANYSRILFHLLSLLRRSRSRFAFSHSSFSVVSPI